MAGKLETLIRDLRLRRGRERRGLALAEGVRLVEEAVAAEVPSGGAAVPPHLAARARGRAPTAALERATTITELDDRALAELADTEHPQGVIAVVDPPTWSWEHLTTATGAVLVALDGVQDPGNVGTILRTAHGLGAAGVIALKGSAELHNPKVMRASMGALFRLPAFSATDEALVEWAGAERVDLWVADAGGTPVETAWTPSGRPVCLVLGNEGAGVSPTLAARARHRVGIPLVIDTESLNVAVAAGILLYEVLRER